MSAATATRRITATEYISRLEAMGLRVEREGPGQWRAQCPLPDHDDRNPSLAIGTSQDGKLLLHCRSHPGAQTLADFLTVAGFESSAAPYLVSSPRVVSSSRSGSGVQIPGNKGDSAVSSFDGDGPLFVQLRAYRRGTMEPDFEVPLRTDRLPPNASTLRSAAKWIAVIMGFVMTNGDFEAAPISTSLLAYLMGLDPDKGKRLASTWLHKLESYGVIRQDGARHIRGRTTPVRCFQPADQTLAEIGGLEVVPAEAAHLRQVVLDEAPEVPDQLRVDQTEVAERREVGVIASLGSALPKAEARIPSEVEAVTVGHSTKPLIVDTDSGDDDSTEVGHIYYAASEFERQRIAAYPQTDWTLDRREVLRMRAQVAA